MDGNTELHGNVAAQVRCPSRAQTPATYHQFPEEDDSWRLKPDGTRTCSFCGSLHPDDMTDIMYEYAIGTEGYKFDIAAKNYKLYGNRPGVRNALDGGIKFYMWHLPDDRLEFEAMYSLAYTKYRAYILDRWGQDIG